MDLDKVRLQIRTIIFGIAGIFAFIIFIGTLVDISGPSTNFIFDFFSLAAHILISPFEGAFLEEGENLLRTIHMDAIIVIGFYFFLAFVISEFITGFFHESGAEILKNVIDGLIKIIELFLFIRIILDLFGAWMRDSLPSFVDLVYSITAWADNLLLPIIIGSMRINLSMIVMLIIFIIIDLFCERFLQNIFEGIGNLLGNAAGREFKLPSLRDGLRKVFRRD